MNAGDDASGGCGIVLSDVARDVVEIRQRLIAKNNGHPCVHAEAREELANLGGIGVARTGQAAVDLRPLGVRQSRVSKIRQSVGKLVDQHFLGLRRQRTHRLQKVGKLLGNALGHDDTYYLTGQDQPSRPSSRRTASSSARTPRSASSTVIDSAGLWLMPSLQRRKIMPEGQCRAP